MEPMQGKLASSQFDFVYTEQFCIPGETSVFFSSCDSGVGALWSSIKQIEAPYVSDWENAIALDTMQRNRSSSRREGKVSWVFLELWQKPGVYSRGTAGMSIRNSSLLIEIRNLSRYEGQLRNVNLAWQENTDASGS